MTYRVTFDGDRVFTAETVDPGGWNGWACPRFTRAQADEVAAYCNAEADRNPDAERVVWDEDWQSYRIAADTDEDVPEYVAADASGLYPIGAYAWTWTVVA